MNSRNLAARAGRWSAPHWKTATAIWIATLIRGVLLPAAMKLLGDWNWYPPAWLEWLPRLTAEPDLREDVPESPAVPAA